jgi:ADP-ribosyl-[dinitrogen reductase] hydrolase
MSEIGTTERWPETFAGVLLGTAVGDALGLPGEGMSRERIERRWGGQWEHRFLFGRGMISDDTEHTLFVAQALLQHPDDPTAFQRCLAWKLRLWLLGIPAGVGCATLRAILRMWVGFSPDHSGVCSAGNGPAMRSAILGAYFADNPDKRRAFVRASTRLTHVDPRAETAAQTVADAAAWAAAGDGSLDRWIATLPGEAADEEWRTLCRSLKEALAEGRSVREFADAVGLQRGVTGYAYHTVPVALYAWARHSGDFREGLVEALRCGGDTDTLGAIFGALMGARVGSRGIPIEWLGGICDWPRSVGLLNRVALRLGTQKTTGRPCGPVRYFWLGLLFRNLVFMVTILTHGVRRLCPPY